MAINVKETHFAFLHGLMHELYDQLEQYGQLLMQLPGPRPIVKLWNDLTYSIDRYIQWTCVR